MLLKRYRAQITAVKNITDIQAQIRSDEQIDKEYPTPKKEISPKKAEPKKAPAEKSDVPESKTEKSEIKDKPVEPPKTAEPEKEKAPAPVFAVAEPKESKFETLDSSSSDGIEDINSSSIKREPISKSDLKAEDIEVKFNDFKFGSDFDIHSKK